MSHDINNTTNLNNNTVSELKGSKKPSKNKKKDIDAVEEFGQGPNDSPEVRSNEKLKKQPPQKKKV
jgi:hypothetical protein